MQARPDLGPGLPGLHGPFLSSNRALHGPLLGLQAGMTIVPVGVDAQGNINVAELKQKAEQHK